jgi:hypothetical protein
MDAGAFIEGSSYSWSIGLDLMSRPKLHGEYYAPAPKYVWTSIDPSLYGVSTKESWR